MAVLINGWKDLIGLESENYQLEVDLNGGCGWLRSKIDSDDDIYLSTHTFYGRDYKEYTLILQECGFDVQLRNWDGETEQVCMADQWLHHGKCEFCRKSSYCTKVCKASNNHREHLAFLNSIRRGEDYPSRQV